MKFFILCCFFVSLVTFSTPLQGAESKSRHADNITCLVSGNFKRVRLETETVCLYVSIQGARSAQKFLKAVKDAFKKEGYIIAQSPSAADVILQLTVAYLGRANSADLRAAVENGYNGTMSVTGKNTLVLLADALLVTREIPEARDETQLKLKNISQRLALFSSTLRLGFASTGQKNTETPTDCFADIFAKTIAKKVKNALPH